MELKEYLKSNFLVLDGAMGTMLQNAGMEAGALPELYNLTNPELITSIHRQYVEAGSDMVLTCTFGANEKKAAGCGHEIEELITAAVNNARASGAKFVGLDIGPIGELLAPMGTLDFDDAYRIFARQIVCGAQAGADAIYIETMTDLLETKAAVLAAKENCDLPVFATMSFEATGRTFLGVPPEAAVITLEGLGVDAIGINCSLGPVEILPIAAQMAKYASIPLILKPNAGLPVVSDGSFHYNITPAQFIEALHEYLPLRFTVFGGCCGTSPEYIRGIRTMLNDAAFALPERKHFSALCSGTKFVLADGVCVIGERINPTGKKKFKAALQEHNIDYVIDQGIQQADAGAHILDVNVGLPGIDEREMMLEVTQELQSVLDLPLQLDSNDPNVLEASLRRYNGVPMINSVNGEDASLEGILPLVAKYGTMVVGLTLDENGIPDSIEKRI
ncbi:MAG: homocysteine S-methyltransferase family protein, partial [Butyricicoccaceae bacterium]